MGGGIDHQPSDKVAYDGQKIHRYVGDEAGKCFAKGTKVRMWDGSVKNIEDIENGELVKQWAQENMFEGKKVNLEKTRTIADIILRCLESVQKIGQIAGTAIVK